MNYKSFLASITVFFIAPNYLMEMNNDFYLKNNEIVKIFSEYNKTGNQFIGLHLSNQNSTDLALSNNKNQTEPPLILKFGEKNFPDTKHNGDLFNNNGDKTSYIEEYCRSLNFILVEKGINNLTINGKIIEGTSITDGVLYKTQEDNKDPDRILTNFQTATLTNLPKCFSNYEDFEYEKELSRTTQLAFDKLYKWRGCFYNTLNLDTIYREELKKCNDTLPEKYLNDPEIIKGLTESTQYIDTLDSIFKKFNSQNSWGKTVEETYKNHQIKCDFLKKIKPLLNIEKIFYENCNKAIDYDKFSKILKEYQKKFDLLNKLDIKYNNSGYKLFIELKSLLEDYKNNINKKEQKHTDGEPILRENLRQYLNLATELISLHKEMQIQIEHYKLKRYIRIQHDDEELTDYNKKPLYIGSYAHISPAYSYNQDEKKFVPINDITTGIIHSAGISFETNQSPWYNYYKKTGYQELYNDINYRIFDIFGAAFQLAKKNNKNTLYIKMPYIGLGNFLRLYEDKPEEYFVSSFYCQSFINNFEYFFNKKKEYGIDQFTIFFGDGDETYNAKNKSLKKLVNNYINEKKLSKELKDAFENNFITDIDTVDTFNLKGIERRNNNAICLFVRAGDEYANYLNGGIADKSLEQKWLGLPTYGTYPEIVFPEIIATGPFTPLLALQLPKENIIVNKTPEFFETINNKAYDYNNIKEKIQTPYRHIIRSIEDSINECTINKDKKEIILCHISNFVSAFLKDLNNDGINYGRGQDSSDTKKLDLFLDQNNFFYFFHDLLEKIKQTANTDKLTIDMDSLFDGLNEIKNLPIYNNFKKLIRNTITLISKENLYPNIQFKYTHYVKEEIKDIEETINNGNGTNTDYGDACYKMTALFSYETHKDRIIDEKHSYKIPGDQREFLLGNKDEKEKSTKIINTELDKIKKNWDSNFNLNNKTKNENEQAWQIKFNDKLNQNTKEDMTILQYFQNLNDLNHIINEAITKYFIQEKDKNITGMQKAIIKTAQNQEYQKVFFKLLSKYINCSLYVGDSEHNPIKLIELPINDSINTFINNLVKNKAQKHHSNEKWNIIGLLSSNVFKRLDQETRNKMNEMKVLKINTNTKNINFKSKFNNFIKCYEVNIDYSKTNNSINNNKDNAQVNEPGKDNPKHLITFYGEKDKNIDDTTFKEHYYNRDPNANIKQPLLLEKILEIIENPQIWNDIVDNCSIIYPEKYDYEEVKNMFQLKAPTYINAKARNRNRELIDNLWDCFLEEDVIKNNKINNNTYNKSTIPAFISGLFPWFKFNGQKKKLIEEEDKLGIIFAHAVNFESRDTLDYKNYLDQSGNINKNKSNDLQEYIQNITDTIIYSGIELTKKGKKEICYLRIPAIGLGAFKKEYSEQKTSLESLYLEAFKQSLIKYNQLAENNNIQIYIDFFNFANISQYSKAYQEIFKEFSNTTSLFGNGCSVFDSRHTSKNVTGDKKERVQTIIVHAGDAHSYLGNRGYYDRSLERCLLGYMNNDYLTPAHTLNLLLQYFFISDENKVKLTNKETFQQTDNNCNELEQNIKNEIEEIKINNYTTTEKGEIEFARITDKINNIDIIMNLKFYYQKPNEPNKQKDSLFKTDCLKKINQLRETLKNVIEKQKKEEQEKIDRQPLILIDGNELNALIEEFSKIKTAEFLYRDHFGTKQINYYNGTGEIFDQIVEKLNDVIQKFDKLLYEKLTMPENQETYQKTIKNIEEYIKNLPHANYLNNNKIDTNKIKNWYDPNQEIEVAAVKSENKEAPVAEVVRVVPVVGTGKNPKKIQWPTYLGGLAGVILLITVLKYRNNIYTSIESFCNKNIFKKKVII